MYFYSFLHFENQALTCSGLIYDPLHLLFSFSHIFSSLYVVMAYLGVRLPSILQRCSSIPLY
jgi:hypothetical protein